jgi:hypothetical protein
LYGVEVFRTELYERMVRNRGAMEDELVTDKSQRITRPGQGMKGNFGAQEKGKQKGIKRGK